MQATDAGENYEQSAFRRLGSDGDGGSSVGDVTLTPVEKQEEKDNLTIQPITEDSSDSSFPTTSIIIIAVGSVIFLSLVFFLAVFRRGRTSSDQNDSYNYPPENSRFCMKRTTFAVEDASRTGFEEIDSSGSVVPVLGGNISLGKMQEGSQVELKPSWAEASAATSSYSVAPLSSRHTRPAPPMRIYAPPRGRGFGDSHAASDFSHSSHTDDYSIGMLESPVSTEYSLGSEGDGVFLSDEIDIDSYRSMDYTMLSTTSSDVFGSNRVGQHGSAWKQVYGPNDTPPGQSRLSTGSLFVRNIDSSDMRRMRMDTRAHAGRGQILLDVEI
eukprot:jgi/Phyca11/124987/e_gw1.55.226.1